MPAPQPVVAPRTAPAEPPVAVPQHVAAPKPAFQRPPPAVARPIGAPASDPVAEPRPTPTAKPAARPETPAARPESQAAIPRDVPTAIAPAASLPAPRRERVVLLGLALAVATLVLVALLRSGDEAGQMVAAAPPASAATAPTRPAAEAPPANPSRTKYDNQLYDLANRYTVRLIQYPNDARGLALATDTYRFLLKGGYPVASPILLANGKGIVLCADAAPTDVELIPLRDNLRGLRYPTDSKDRPFATAFVDKIDNVLAR